MILPPNVRWTSVRGEVDSVSRSQTECRFDRVSIRNKPFADDFFFFASVSDLVSVEAETGLVAWGAGVGLMDSSCSCNWSRRYFRNSEQSCCTFGENHGGFDSLKNCSGRYAGLYKTKTLDNSTKYILIPFQINEKACGIKVYSIQYQNRWRLVSVANAVPAGFVKLPACQFSHVLCSFLFATSNSEINFLDRQEFDSVLFCNLWPLLLITTRQICTYYYCTIFKSGWTHATGWH